MKSKRCQCNDDHELPLYPDIKQLEFLNCIWIVNCIAFVTLLFWSSLIASRFLACGRKASKFLNLFYTFAISTIVISMFMCVSYFYSNQSLAED